MHCRLDGQHVSWNELGLELRKEVRRCFHEKLCSQSAGQIQAYPATSSPTRASCLVRTDFWQARARIKGGRYHYHRIQTPCKKSLTFMGTHRSNTRSEYGNTNNSQ